MLKDSEKRVRWQMKVIKRDARRWGMQLLSAGLSGQRIPAFLSEIVFPVYVRLRESSWWRQWFYRRGRRRRAAIPRLLASLSFSKYSRISQSSFSHEKLLSIHCLTLRETMDL